MTTFDAERRFRLIDVRQNATRLLIVRIQQYREIDEAARHPQLEGGRI